MLSDNTRHIIRKIIHLPLGALLCNLITVFVLFQVTRLVFFLCNYGLFADHMSVGYLFSIMVAGLHFDMTAIFYLNSWMILLFLFPLHWKERWFQVPGSSQSSDGKAGARFQVGCRLFYVIVNFIGLAANLCDCAYFPFTGKRTTSDVLAEFGHEGNFATIILHEALPYWYLFIIAVILAWVLWKTFVTPQVSIDKSWKGYLRYYIIQVILLPLVAWLTVAGIRGGFTTAVRPIHMSNANQYVDHAIDAGLVLNTPFCIMRTLGDDAFTDVNYMPMAEAQKIYTPVHTPADTVQFKKMNVVVLILESFGKQSMARGYMPFISELSKKGISFRYSYATGRKSIDGMPSVLSSIPSFVEPFFLTPAALNDISGIAGELTRYKGYSSAFFHGAQNGSMGFQAFAKSSGFQKYYGRTEYNEASKAPGSRFHGDDDFDGTWAIWDEEFLQFFCDKISEMKQPFVASVFTATSHPPYNMPERYKKVFPATKTEIFAVTAYSDHAVRLFFEKASKQPWFKNTLFVVTADHAQPGPIDTTFKSNIGMYKIPIVFYAPGLPEKMTGEDKERIICQADIMPTVMGLLGYDRPYIAFGEDVLHTAPADTHAFNYLTEGRYFQYLQGDWMLQFDGQNVVHSYKFKTDTLLAHDMKNHYPKIYEQRLKSVIQQYMYRMNHNELIIKKK